MLVWENKKVFILVIDYMMLKVNSLLSEQNVGFHSTKIKKQKLSINRSESMSSGVIYFIVFFINKA